MGYCEADEKADKNATRNDARRDARRARRRVVRMHRFRRQRRRKSIGSGVGHFFGPPAKNWAPLFPFFLFFVLPIDRP